MLEEFVWKDSYVLLAWAAGITIIAVIIGWWLKRKFGRTQ
jgi:hypothetical protein